MDESQLPGKNSFIVLNRCTDDENNDALSFPQFELKMNKENFHMSSMSDVQHIASNDSQVILPDIGDETTEINNSNDVEMRLSAILNENVTLKETLHQNNMAMKQQFNTLCLWQEEVLKVHQTHKERFEETKQLIIKLMAENKELRLSNEGNKEQLALKQLQTEKEELQKQLAEALQNLNIITLKANRKRNQQSVKEKELGSVIEMLTKRLEIAERARRQLEIDVEKLSFQKSRIEQQLAQKDNVPENERVSNVSEHRTQTISCVTENTTGSEVFQNIKKFLRENKRPLDESVNNKESCQNIEEMQERMCLINKIVTQEKEYNLKATELLQMAYSEYQEIIKLIKHSTTGKTESANHKGNMESIDLLLAKVVSQDEELLLRNEQLHNLRLRMQTLESENEAIQILKAQVAVYQSDFNIERKNREKLASERDRLVIEIQQLRKQNKELMNERELYQSCQCSHLKRLIEEAPASISGQDKVGTGDFFCPNPDCNMSFTTVGPLQIHVEKCLKLTD